MTNDRDYTDPASVDLEKVQPLPGLGSGLEQAPFPSLFFSTKSRVWGDKSGKSWEPDVKEFKSGGLKEKTLSREGYRCMFCGFHSSHNQVHNVSDNHQDVREVNLKAVDVICHGWNHLGELNDGEAVIAYLPGVSPQDINHLQRTLMVALQIGDKEQQADAKKLLNWLGSHMTYAKNAWGTCSPAVFAQALLRQDGSEKERREAVFEDLAVVFNPGPMNKVAALWAREYQVSYPSTKWREVFHGVINPPA